MTPFGPLRRIDFLTGYYALNNFALVHRVKRNKGYSWKSSYEFHECREIFGRIFTSRKANIVFVCRYRSRKSIAAFILRIEEKLKIPKKDRSRFGPTQRNTIIWIKVSSFWMSEPIRRSLFTALLRAATNYKAHTRNFKQALYSRAYLNKTKPAVERFLAGHTHFVGRCLGWQSTFSSSRRWEYGENDWRSSVMGHYVRVPVPDEKQLERMLRKP